MAIAVGLANLVLGVVYTSYGLMTLVDMKRGWRTLGFSHFGAAWTAMAFTCGPHHLIHGIHGLFEGRAGGGLDLAAVLVGFPAGVTWFLLRVEAFRGGSGDRFVTGTPAWILALPAVFAATATAMGIGVAAEVADGFAFRAYVIPNLLLVGLYVTIGYFLLRTQLSNHGALGGWSVSGLALSVVFPTCAAMHAIFAVYHSSGRYGYDPHGFVIDWLAVPAAMYFLWVVRRLYRDALSDWNRDAEPSPAAAVPVG